MTEMESQAEIKNLVVSKGRGCEQSLVQHNCQIFVHFTTFWWKQLFSWFEKTWLQIFFQPIPANCLLCDIRRDSPIALCRSSPSGCVELNMPQKSISLSYTSMGYVRVLRPLSVLARKKFKTLFRLALLKLL